MQGVWGTLVEMEPQDHLGYSNDYRPDVSGRGLGKARTRLIGDVKFKDPLSSNVEDIGRRGAFVGFGNTPRPARGRTSLASRSAASRALLPAGGSGNFSPRTGAGYVAYKKPDYADLRPRAVALRHGLADAALRDLRRLERAGGAALPTDAGHGAEQANETAVRERSELVDVDVARAAGTAPFGGGAHSFGVGDRDRDAACWGWGRGALL